MGIAYLVRHFETESNTKGLFGDGPLDDVPTERGKAQAEALRQIQVKSWHIDEVWACNSVRNHTTATSLGFSLDVLNATSDLNEQHPGEWAGKSKTEISQELLADWRAGRFIIPNSESDEKFQIRVLAFWNIHALPKLKEGKNLLVATSGNPIRVILGSIWKTPWRNLLPALVVDNCSITTIKVNKDGKCFVGPVNDISHLKEVGVTGIPGT